MQPQTNCTEMKLDKLVILVYHFFGITSTFLLLYFNYYWKEGIAKLMFSGHKCESPRVLEFQAENIV